MAPALPFGGEHCSALRAAGLLTPRRHFLTLQVVCYLIEDEHGRILFDTGWNRAMSPQGKSDVRAQIRELGTPLLYLVNQGDVPPGASVSEQLRERHIAPEDLECVLISHLDCDHASGLRELRGAPQVLVSASELAGATAPGFLNRIR